VRFDIRYRTTFEYGALVRESQNELRACPASDEHQQLINYRVMTSPSARVLSHVDYWGTRVDAFGVRPPHVVLDVVAEASVETRPRPLLTESSPVVALADPAFVDAHLEYLQRSPHCQWAGGVAEASARVVEVAGNDVVSQVLAVHRHTGAALRYVKGSTYVGVPIEAVLNRGEGVCQDFAHLAVASCRSVGIPARYVSGYLFTVDDATGADVEGDVVHVQTHAWFEAAVPNVGWVALDPTNHQLVGLRHVKIGHGRDYEDVPPLRGIYVGAARPNVEVTVEIRRAASPTLRRELDLTWANEPVTPPGLFDDALLMRQQQQQQQ
jgi:transglutaminase-like putative cysteine protease